MEQKIRKILSRKRREAFTPEDLGQRLGLEPGQIPQLRRSLDELARQGLIVRVPGGAYLCGTSPDLIAGRIQITRSGRGFLAPEDPSLPEIAIRAEKTGTALHDDRVLVLRASGKGGGGGRRGDAGGPSGAVVKVVERHRARFTGVLRRADGAFSVVPDDPRFQGEVRVPAPKGACRGAKPGDKVVVELERWESRRKGPEGLIVEVLGQPSAEGVDMLGVLRHYDLTCEFPERVVAEARALGTEVRPADLEGRRDCRSQLVFTVDPDDARDFDDAVCIEPAGRGRWKLWVHIADVSHYVKPGSALDEEARRRGNSSYLVDRVVPMLPEELSNELCSLKPRVDRLTKCVEFLLSGDGKVLRTDFYPAVIHSRKRLTYADAMAALEREPRDEIDHALHRAGDLAQSLRKRRFRAGSLDLDFPETKIRLDDKGRIERIDVHANDLSHQLVEEFMLLANEAVAARLMKLKRPAIYRAHEAPDPSRLRDYREEVLGHSIPCGDLAKPGEVQKLLRRLGDLAAGAALKIGFLRSLNRARYSADPLGHYGLAKAKYAHFTSPIRRYADLVVHRTLFRGKGAAAAGEECLHRVADSLSVSERNSSDAERDSKDLKLHAHLEEQIRSGRRVRYTAHVTALRDFGFSVDLPELGMSGMVPFALMKDDRYLHEAGAKLIRGSRTGRIVRLGDRVEVEIAKVDASRKMVDFRLAGAPGHPGAAAREDGPARKRRRSRSRGKGPREERKGGTERREKPVRAAAPRAGKPPEGGKARRRRRGRRGASATRGQ